MLIHVHPKLPMRNKEITRSFYLQQLGFEDAGAMDYEGYLILRKDQIEIHFFEFTNLNPAENYGQIYIRCANIEPYYHQLVQNQVTIHPAGHLQLKPWGLKEFSLLDPDHNLLTFGENT